MYIYGSYSMNKFFQITAFFKHWWRASSEHGVHSPFVYDFYVTLLKRKRRFYAFEAIERQRRLLRASQKAIAVKDFGAGSKTLSSRNRPIKRIVQHSLKSAAVGQFLFTCMRQYGSKQALELGTSLGITSAYLASVGKDVALTTIEACPETAAVAKETFEALGLSNVRLVEGTFDEVLPGILSEGNSFDFVFVDGNHRGDATYRYFEMLLPKMAPDSMIIFDDIYWSEDMAKAWGKIKLHPAAGLTIDIYELGIVIFRDHFEKQHFDLHHRFKN